MEWPKNLKQFHPTTHQKLLSMEKKGAQVVERDLILPVDIILDATTCLVWYDCKNIGNKATAQDEGSSGIPLCIENIAANVLTSLSFTFTACVLVFEGDSNFLGTVVELADELYAAAASLGTNIQIFYSHSFELTDEIILKSIEQARKLSQGLLPRVPETETHVESFLTKFPSFNPLSAHAIISCGCKLLEFLELSGDNRMHALRNYHLPEESVNLLNALSKYGEREESKSGVTDCSSSVSSPPESEKTDRRMKSTDKKRKFMSHSPDAVHDLRWSMPSNECDDEWLNYDGRPLVSKATQSPRISLQKKLRDFTLDEELYCEGDGPGIAAKNNSCKAWSDSYDIGTERIPRLSEEFGKTTLFSVDGFGEPILNSAGKVKGQECTMERLKDLREDLVGEVVDVYEKSPIGMDFDASGIACKSFPMDFGAFIDHAPRNRTARRLSFNSGSYLNFPSAGDMKTSCELEDTRHLRDENGYDSRDYDWGTAVSKPQQDLMGTSSYGKSFLSFSDPLLKEKAVPSHGETPLSKAVHSAQLQQGSPWTIEFLNRIKEKKRLRPQNQPCGTSVPQTANRGNIGRFTKRRSPSILEYYKYQGGVQGSTPRKVTQQKQQNQHGQLSSEKPSGLRSTWTPIDKRARRSLSFESSGKGSQTKLVWGENMSCSQISRFFN